MASEPEPAFGGADVKLIFACELTHRFALMITRMPHRSRVATPTASPDRVFSLPESLRER